MSAFECKCGKKFDSNNDLMSHLNFECPCITRSKKSDLRTPNNTTSQKIKISCEEYDKIANHIIRIKYDDFATELDKITDINPECIGMVRTLLKEHDRIHQETFDKLKLILLLEASNSFLRSNLPPRNKIDSTTSVLSSNNDQSANYSKPINNKPINNNKPTNNNHKINLKKIIENNDIDSISINDISDADSIDEKPIRKRSSKISNDSEDDLPNFKIEYYKENSNKTTSKSVTPKKKTTPKSCSKASKENSIDSEDDLSNLKIKHYKKNSKKTTSKPVTPKKKTIPKSKSKSGSKAAKRY